MRKSLGAALVILAISIGYFTFLLLTMMMNPDLTHEDYISTLKNRAYNNPWLIISITICIISMCIGMYLLLSKSKSRNLE